MTDETYNGWKNRETWALMLHVNNDQALYEDFREAARASSTGEDDYRTPRDFVHENADRYFTRDGYADEFGDTWPDALADIAAEIGSLWRVDWEEVTAALLEN